MNKQINQFNKHLMLMIKTIENIIRKHTAIFFICTLGILA